MNGAIYRINIFTIFNWLVVELTTLCDLGFFFWIFFVKFPFQHCCYLAVKSFPEQGLTSPVFSCYQKVFDNWF